LLIKWLHAWDFGVGSTRSKMGISFGIISSYVFGHQTPDVSLYPLQSGKLYISAMQKWHRTGLVIKPLYASEIGVDSSRMKV